MSTYLKEDMKDDLKKAELRIISQCAIIKSLEQDKESLRNQVLEREIDLTLASNDFEAYASKIEELEKANKKLRKKRITGIVVEVAMGLALIAIGYGFGSI